MHITPDDMLSLQERLKQLSCDVTDAIDIHRSGKMRLMEQHITDINGAFEHLLAMRPDRHAAKKWDLEAAPKRHENQTDEHEMEYLLSRGLAGLVKVVVNPQTPLAKAERKALLLDIKELVEKCDDVGIFISQGANKEGLTTNPTDIGAYGRKHRAESLMKGKEPNERGEVEIKPEEMAEFRRLSEGFEPSNRGLFLNIQKELAKLDRGAARE